MARFVCRRLCQNTSLFAFRNEAGGGEWTWEKKEKKKMRAIYGEKKRNSEGKCNRPSSGLMQESEFGFREFDSCAGLQRSILLLLHVESITTIYLDNGLLYVTVNAHIQRKKTRINAFQVYSHG